MVDKKRKRRSLKGLKDQLSGGRALLDKEVFSIQNDIPFRFTQGFLDDKFSKKLLERSLKRHFPDSEFDIQEADDGNLKFSVDGSDFKEVDPSNMNDLVGEIAEQVGRFNEVVSDVGAGLLTANPLAAGASAGVFQALREVHEARIGEPIGIDDVGQVVGNAGLATVLGEAGNRIGKAVGKLAGSGARQATREGAQDAANPLADKLKLRAGEVLEEQSTRELEFITEGADPVEFARKVRGNAQAFKNSFESQANSAFKAGRDLAEQEGAQIATNINPFLDEISELMGDEQLNRKFLKTLTNKVNQAGQKVGKPSLVDEAGEVVVDFSQLSPNEVIKAREFTSQFIQANSGKPDANLLIKFKTQLNGSLDELASQGSDAARQYNTGIAKIRELNERFSPNLQKKILGKAPVDFPSTADEVTPKEFLKKIKSGSGFDENELAQLSDVGGFADNPELRFEATQNIIKEGLEGFGKGRVTPNTRLNKLSQQDLDIARNFVSDEALTQAQKQGFSIKPDVLEETLSPANRLARGQTFNLQSASDKLFDNRGGLGQAGEILGGESFDQAKPFLEDAFVNSQLAQGKGASLVESGLMGAGRNQVNVATAPGGLISNTLGEVGRLGSAAVRGVAGEIPENLGNAVFTQTGRLDLLSPEMLQKLGTGLGAGSSEFVNFRR